MRNKKTDPFNWDNISIEKYYTIVDILNDDEDDITKNVKLISTILDKPESEIWDMDLSQVGDYVSRLQFLNKFDIPSSPKMKIHLPNYNLEVIKDLTKINIAQYVDYQNFACMPLRDGMDKILSIFLIPEGCTYNNGYDVLDVQKEIRENMSFRVAEGLLGFFLKKYSEYLIHSLAYCKRMMKKMKNQEMKKEVEEKMMKVRDQIEHLTSLIGYYS